MLLALAAVFWLTYESAAAVDWKQKAADNKPIPPSDCRNRYGNPGYAVYENSCA